MLRTCLLLSTLAFLGGCSIMESKSIDYQSAGSVPSLEVPPDLLLPSADRRFAIPDTASAGASTYSDFSRGQARQPTGETARLLPEVDKVRIERGGTQRWLVVDLPQEQVWPVVKDFWQQLGFIINVEIPEAGVMETDWAENRAKIPQDSVRNFLGKALDSLYSTAERDRFRTRLEPAAAGKGTEIYISHRGMYEVFEGTQSGADQGQGRTVWQPRPADPELEAEMLSRLMVRFGVEESRSRTLLAEPAGEPRATLTQTAGAPPKLSLPEGFDRAWRRVGLALDRIGFAVEDRDRVAGIYYVRYADAEANTKKDKGFLSKLAFWSSAEPKVLAQRYRVKVGALGETSEVTVHQEDGAPDKTETGKRILNLLFEQLK